MTQTITVQGKPVKRKFELVGIDLCKPGPIKSKDAITVAEAIWENWVCIFGCQLHRTTLRQMDRWKDSTEQ